MAVAMIGPKFYGWDKNGKPLAFGKLYTYQARTNDPKDTYQSEDQIVPNTNPVILNGEGYANVYLTGSYKMVLKDKDDNEVWSSDPVSSAEPSEWVICLTANYLSPTSFKVNGNFVTQYEPGRRVRIDNNSANYSYATIRTSVFAGGETTVTIDDGVVTTGLVETCVSIIGPESRTNDGVLNIESLASATSATYIQKGDALNLKQRSNGTGAAMWDVVETVDVTPNGYDVVQSIAKPDLSLVLRTQYNMNIDQFGAVGYGVTNDYGAINAAIEKAKTLPFGALIKGRASGKYLILTGLVIDQSGIVIDFDGGELSVQYEGWGVQIGNDNNVMSNLGIRNAVVTAATSSTGQNGVLYSTNVRRNIAHENLYIAGFKGRGLEFRKLNWSIQKDVSPIIENCGVGLFLGENTNAITIASIAIDGSTTYNVQMEGVFTITFVGGYLQNAGVAGVFANKTVLQPTKGLSFYGVYFEANGANHIWCTNCFSITVNGCYMNSPTMTGAAIRLDDCKGANIVGNTPVGMSQTIVRDFVQTNANCTLIDVGPQSVTTSLDASININGGSDDGIIGAFNKELPTLPVASNLNLGSIVNFVPSGLASSRPYLCRTNGSADRKFSEIALKNVKQNATSGAGLLTPNLQSFNIYDFTMTAPLTVNAPTGQFKDGDELTIILKNNNGGDAVTFNAIYKTSYSDTGNAAGTHCSVTFVYSAARNLWIQTGILPWV